MYFWIYNWLMKEANIPPFKDISKIRTRNHLPSSQVDVEKIFNLKRPWVSCMSDSSPNVAWQLHHVLSCKRIHLSFAWNHHPLSTDKICWMPTGWWCQKQLTVAFVVLKNSYYFFAVDFPLEDLLMPTGCWRCPLAAFVSFV